MLAAAGAMSRTSILLLPEWVIAYSSEELRSDSQLTVSDFAADRADNRSTQSSVGQVGRESPPR